MFTSQQLRWRPPRRWRQSPKSNLRGLSETADVVVATEWIEVSLDPAMVRVRDDEPGDALSVSIIRVPAKLKVFGGAKQLVGPRGDPIEAVEPDFSLQKAIARGRRWEAQLASGERAGAEDIAVAEGIASRYVDKLLKLAWIAPDLTEAILNGRRLRDTDLTRLLAADIPSRWRAQRAFLALG